MLVYYVDFSEFSGSNRDTSTKVIASSDGTTFGTPRTVTLDDAEIEAGNIADASVVQLDDGRLRLYFMNTLGPNDRSTPIYSATSTDGVHFELDEGIGACERDGELEYYTHTGTASGAMQYAFNERRGIAEERSRTEWISRGGMSDVSPVPLPDGSTLVYFKRLGG